MNWIAFFGGLFVGVIAGAGSAMPYVKVLKRQAQDLMDRHQAYLKAEAEKRYNRSQAQIRRHAARREVSA